MTVSVPAHVGYGGDAPREGHDVDFGPVTTPFGEENVTMIVEGVERSDRKDVDVDVAHHAHDHREHRGERYVVPASVHSAILFPTGGIDGDGPRPITHIDVPNRRNNAHASESAQQLALDRRERTSKRSRIRSERCSVEVHAR